MLPLLPVSVVILLPLAFTLWTRWNRWQDTPQHARGRFKRMLTVGILAAQRRYRRRFLLATGGAVLVALLIIVVSWLSWQWREPVAPPLWSLPLLILLWAATFCLAESYVH
ncbi:hypothetical protein [Thermogemmatispora sp.]|uniref:hypothetical protein n=1 Tax=Thermogemmatispora sp. TaxID=1968838 RepID=UPI001DCC8D01|nr:hypothetical protein [Thermogemmatispora sp.]MBX5451020.1 hypothetical protein [Thermogemmatispora sp.]